MFYYIAFIIFCLLVIHIGVGLKRPFVSASIFLICAIILGAMNTSQDLGARKASRQMVEEIKEKKKEGLPDYRLAPYMDMPEEMIGGYLCIGYLSMEDIELPVISRHDDEVYEKLRSAPVRYEGSVYSHDIIICGHNYPSHFRILWNMEEGTEVSFTDISGNRFVYEMAERRIIGPYDYEEMTEGDWDMILYTCVLGGRQRCACTFRLVKDIPAQEGDINGDT